MNKNKIGDYVTVEDDAWGRVLNGGRAGERVRRCNALLKPRRFQIVATGRIPITTLFTANTLIATIDESPQVFVAINDCDLLPYVADIDIQFVVAGEVVTTKLSKESKDEVLRAYYRSYKT